MWKYNLKTRHGLLASAKAIFETIMHQRADPSDIEAMRKRALTSLARRYRSSTSPAAAGTMSNQFIETIDLLATSVTPLNAITLFESPAFLTVAVTSLTRLGLHSSVMETQTALLSLICGALAGGPQVMKSLLLLGVKTICSNLMFGPLHGEACALLAVLRLGETNFARPTKSIMPSSFWCANFSEERLAAVTEGLNGIWRHFMFYDNMDLKNVMELGASHLRFDAENGSILGEGSDTLGAFHINDASNFNLRSGEVTIIREYVNGPVIEFVGVAHPFGFGGFFQLAQTTDDLSNDEPPVLLGYWMSHLQYKSLTEDEWKVFVADMKSKAAKRRMGKHPEPWAEAPGPVAMMSQELRHMTRSTFNMSLPSASYAEIYSELEKLPDIAEEELRKYVSPPILRGPGETEEKFRLRENTHTMMMMMLFERRATFGLQKWEEIEHDFQALQTGDVSSPAILHKWHDYLCLYTFDNYTLSSGVDGLCQFFSMVLSMAQEIRAQGGNPSHLALGPHADSSSTTAAATAASSSSSSTGDASGSMLDNYMDKLPAFIPKDEVDDEDAEEIQADKDGVDVATPNGSHPQHPQHNKLKKDTSIESEDGSDVESEEEDDEEEDDDDEEEEEEDGAGQTSAMKQKRRRGQSSSVFGTPATIVVAVGVVAAITAGVYALTRYIVRPKSQKQ
jgi:hypothetical protein